MKQSAIPSRARTLVATAGYDGSYPWVLGDPSLLVSAKRAGIIAFCDERGIDRALVDPG